MYLDLGLTSAAIVGLLSAFITGAGLFLAWRQARERQLRKDDVLKWANEVIRTLQSLYLYCYLEGRAIEPEKLRAIAADTSILVEQGRLFFRNTPDPTYGADRHPAYRGYRPKLLDPIVVAHQIAMQWDGAAADERQRMTLVAEDCVKIFVSLAQLEVGRSQTASIDAGQKGEGRRLDDLMELIPDKRLAALAEARRKSL
jgi:hypothetical protein